MKLRSHHFTFLEAAKEIGAVVRGERAPLIPLPSVKFPPNYQITEQAVYQAYRRGLVRRPQLTAEEWRQQDQIRCDSASLCLQQGLNAGDAKIARVWLQIQNHVADVNGYRVPPQVRIKAEVANQEEEDNDQIDVLREMTEKEADEVSEIMARCRQRLHDRKNPPAR